MAGTIEIVGWDNFQHYKDRDPPWVKLYRDLLTSESWVIGTDHSRLVQVASILLAARYHNATPASWELVRKVASLDMTEEEFHRALEHLANHKFLIVKGEMRNASKALAPRYQSARPETEKRREEGEKSREDTTAVAARGPDEEQFARFQTLYPKRAGSQPWKRAAKAITARLKAGDSWDDIHDGTRRYADYCQVTGKVNTEHVMQAATFCGPDRHYAADWTPPPTKGEARLRGNIAVMQQFLQEELQ